jgi:DNA polymerase-3 subunit beta
MKVRLNRQELADALGAIGVVAATRTTKPILQCVLLDARADHMLLAATDLEVGIRCTIAQVEVDEQGQVVVAADKLNQIVRESTDEVLALTSDDSICHIRGQGAHFQIYTHDPADFPPVAELEGKPDFELPAGTLKRMAEWTVFAAAKENTRYAINGVLWEKDKQNLALVATDGRRLSLAKGALPKGDGANLECIVPVKAMGLFQRVLGDPESPVAVKASATQLVLRTTKATVSTALVEGQFPRYRDVIPADCDRTVKLGAMDFLSAVRRAALLTNEESKGVRLTFRKNQLVLSSRAPSQGEATIEVPVDYAGVEMEIGFNPHFLIEALKNVGVDEVTLQLKDSARPGVLKGAPDFLYVVMPVNLS